MIEEKDVKTGTCSENFRSLLGCLFALIAAVLAALSGVLVKYVDEPESEQLQLARSVVQFSFMLPILSYRRDSFFRPQVKVNIILLCRAFCGCFANWFWLYSIIYIPVGDASAIISCNVILTGIFARCFLKERYGVVQCILSFVTVAGLVLIARPSVIFGESSDSTSQSDRTFGSVLAFSAAFGSAVTFVLIRKLGTDIHFSLSMFHYAWAGVLTMSLLSIARNTLYLPCLHDVLVMAAAAIISMSASVMFTLALQNEKAGKAVLIMSTSVFFSFAFEMIFRPYKVEWTSVVGSALVVGSSFFVTFSQIRKKLAST